MDLSFDENTLEEANDFLGYLSDNCDINRIQQIDELDNIGINNASRNTFFYSTLDDLSITQGIF
jgi:hypothetical protein